MSEVPAEPPLESVEEARHMLGLTYREIAASLGADESTLHRWRAGTSAPRPVFRQRMAALREMREELSAVMRPEDGAAWLRTPSPALDGRSPSELLVEGRIEAVTRLLLRLNLGTST
jgi:transcriptional regulator with XRE-family HTH domain